MITIVDYGLGNIRAFLNVFKRLRIEARTAATAADLAGSSKLILPGVGHFDGAMRLLNGSGMRDALDDLVLRERVPVLGICVGMQMLARSSEEGTEPGLGWLDGTVKSFHTLLPGTPWPVPHMGWNDVRPLARRGLFDALESDGRFYFLHSYCFDSDRSEDVAAVATYGLEFTCAVHRDNVYGVQFHPEKSHQWGSQLLKNFASL
jgi:glutamine amidotransferase